MDKKQLQQRVTEQRRRVRRRLTIRGVLSLLVVLTFIRCAFMQRYENMFVCVLSLVLLAMPTLIEKQLAIDIPPMMEAIIYCFISPRSWARSIRSTPSFPDGTPCCTR